MHRNPKHRYERWPLGAVSEGTLRIEDLLPAAAYELEHTVKPDAKAKALLREYNDLPDLEDADRETLEQAEFLYEEMVDKLDELAPPYVYFGGSHGDPAAVGWWVAWDAVEDDIRSGEILRITDWSELPKNYTGLVAHVDDHGGVIFGKATKGRFREIWSI